MRIACPACSAIYEVPDRLVGTGKRLRCARCANEWVPPEMAAAAPVPAMPPPPEPPPRQAAAPTPEPAALPPPERVPRPQVPALHGEPKPKLSASGRRSARLPVMLALALSTALVAALLAAGILWRGAVMQAFPPSRLLFQALGLA